MILTGQIRLDEFCADHADVRKQIEVWKNEVEDANWETPIDIKERFQSASIINGTTIVFNIKGNDYRLLTKIDFVTKIVLVVKIGTHAEYEKWEI